MSSLFSDTDENVAVLKPVFRYRTRKRLKIKIYFFEVKYLGFITDFMTKMQKLNQKQERLISR